jgi:[protein-PII] uridylyltransferase
VWAASSTWFTASRVDGASRMSSLRLANAGNIRRANLRFLDVIHVGNGPVTCPFFVAVMLTNNMPAGSRRDPVSDFLDSMPWRYREIFDAPSAREHAAIVARRGTEPAHVELWRKLPRGGAVVCVAADDCPGLLSFISAALVVHRLDVEAAQAYTRQAKDAPEAVDFFWLRRDGGPPSPILQADVAGIAEVLRGLVAGTVTLDAVAAAARAERVRPAGATTRVRFDETTESGLAVLTVETFDRPGLLLAVTRALHRARVQILASEATTTDGRVVDRFTLVELDGAALRSNRRGVLQVEVLAAVDSLGR